MGRIFKLNLICIASAIAAAFFSTSTFATVDPYNAYLWNSGNVAAGDGAVDTGDWFEWWYYKVVDPQSGQAFFFTYGLSNPWDSGATLKGTSAHVTAGTFQQKFLIDQVFTIDQFSASYDKVSVNIADNTATDKHLTGHTTDSNGHDLAWDLSVDKQWSFDAMGWAMKVPDITGIYWYPAQASAQMSGWVKVDGQTFNLTHAPAYQDRNWGRRLPKWWTWLTSNTFTNSADSFLAVGGGEPDVLDTSVALFSGLCIGLHYQGSDYVFRTTDGDKVDFDIHWGKWTVAAENFSGYRIEISAYAPPDQFMDLPFKSPRGLQFHDYETLLGTMTVQLSQWSFVKGDWDPIVTLQSDQAGIEWGSPTPVALPAGPVFSRLFNTATALRR